MDTVRLAAGKFAAMKASPQAQGEIHRPKTCDGAEFLTPRTPPDCRRQIQKDEVVAMPRPCEDYLAEE